MEFSPAALNWPFPMEERVRNTARGFDSRRRASSHRPQRE
jgi:hypothetical protein